jgi:hypothetical protein
MSINSKTMASLPVGSSLIDKPLLDEVGLQKNFNELDDVRMGRESFKCLDFS